MYDSSQQQLFSAVPSGASSSNSRAAAMDEPQFKRRRVTGKQGPERLNRPDRPNRPDRQAQQPPQPPQQPQQPQQPPRVMVTESLSVNTLFGIKIVDFPAGSLGLEPLSLSDGPLQVIVERRIANSEPFKLKVGIAWEAKTIFGDDDIFR